MNEKKPTRAEKEALPLDAELKGRVMAVKARLPKSGLTSTLAHLYPDDYDTVKGKSLVSNVLQLRTTDATVTERLEQYADLLEKPEINTNS